VVKLRGYGNAIVPQLAAEFISVLHNDVMSHSPSDSKPL
jgi:hypothetical protein